MCEDVNDAIDHCRERLDVYDSGADCVRVKRKFLERLVRYAEKPAVQSLVNGFRKKLTERDEIIEALKNTNATLRSNLKLRDEQLDILAKHNWRRVAADSQKRVDVLEKQLSEAKDAKYRLKSFVFATQKKLAASETQRDKLKKLVEHIYTSQSHGRVHRDTFGYEGTWITRSDKWQNEARDRLGLPAVNPATAPEQCKPDYKSLIERIDSRLRAWADTPSDSTEELRAMARLTETIKAAARVCAKDDS